MRLGASCRGGSRLSRVLGEGCTCWLAASILSQSGVRVPLVAKASRLPYRLSIQHGGSGEPARISDVSGALSK